MVEDVVWRRKGGFVMVEDVVWRRKGGGFGFFDLRALWVMWVLVLVRGRDLGGGGDFLGLLWMWGKMIGRGVGDRGHSVGRKKFLDVKNFSTIEGPERRYRGASGRVPDGCVLSPGSHRRGQPRRDCASDQRLDPVL